MCMKSTANLLTISGILAGAVYTDLRRHRIPNNLIALGLIIAIIFQLVANGAHGLLFGFFAAALGFGCFIPLYELSAMGGRDVKLLAVVRAVVRAEDETHACGPSLLHRGVGGVG